MQKNNDIIIKEADKESSVAILDKMYYKAKIQEIPTEEINNKLINTNINNDISKITKLNIKKEKNFLTTSQKLAIFIDYQKFTNLRK